jgi:hypothetical protein
MAAGARKAAGQKGVIEPAHYSKRYGWHCGMRNYIGRIVMKVAIGATLRGVDTELGDVDRLAREGAC